MIGGQYKKNVTPSEKKTSLRAKRWSPENWRMIITLANFLDPTAALGMTDAALGMTDATLGILVFTFP